MRFLDTTKVACHSILNNKSRSILTVIIVAIVSALMMFIVSLGLVFNNYQLQANRQAFDVEGNTFRINSKDSDKDSTISKTELDGIENLIVKYDHVINSVIYTTQSDAYLDFDIDSYIPLHHQSLTIDTSNFIVNDNDFIIDGRVWNKDDKNKNHIWLSLDYIIELSKKNINVSVGDDIKVSSFKDNNNNKVFNTTLKVIGIYDKNLFPKDNYIYNSAGVLIDSSTAINTLDASVDSIIISYLPPVGVKYDFNSIYKDLSSLNEELTSLLPTYIYNGYEQNRFWTDFLDQMEMSILMGNLIIALAIFLAIIVLLLSIGSVANTIIISVDKNRKFIGLMKALGLNQKGVKKLVHVEAFITIFVGILFGGLLLFATNGLLELIVQTLIDQLFSYNDIKLNVVVSFNYLLPLGVFVIFYLFALLFSKGSLKKISSQDVIETISEVA